MLSNVCVSLCSFIRGETHTYIFSFIHNVHRGFLGQSNCSTYIHFPLMCSMECRKESQKALISAKTNKRIPLYSEFLGKPWYHCVSIFNQSWQASYMNHILLQSSTEMLSHIKVSGVNCERWLRLNSHIANESFSGYIFMYVALLMIIFEKLSNYHRQHHW